VFKYDQSDKKEIKKNTFNYYEYLPRQKSSPTLNSAFKTLSKSNPNKSNLLSRGVQGMNVQPRSQGHSSFHSEEL